MPSLLLIEDEETLAKNTALYMERYGWSVVIAPSAEDALLNLGDVAPDVVLLDFNLPGMNGLEALSRIRQRNPHARVVMLTGHANIQLAIDAMKAGSSDFLSKPVVLAELRRVLDKMVGAAPAPAMPVAPVAPASGSLDMLIGESSEMRELKSRVRRVVKVNTLDGGPPPAILIGGETGSGKELVARACHFESARRDGPFIELNCAAIPDHLLESELFGYERGAFTDARERKIGLIEAADGGTLFLDEIGEANLTIQAKLLKVLEDQRFRRLGSVREQRVDIRIIAATNQNLDNSVKEGHFRADLLYRLRVINFMIPPLRERGSDIGLLAARFLEQMGRRYGKETLTLTGDAIDALQKYEWPGNVRELRNVIEQTVLLATGPMVDAHALSLPHAAALQSVAGTHAGTNGDMGLAAAEIDLIRRALENTGWNITRAAVVLGVSRDTLRYRMEKHGLQKDNFMGRTFVCAKAVHLPH